MTEPWQDAFPEPGAGQLGARFVCRVSGAPADAVDELRAHRTLETLALLAERERWLAERREEVSALLFAAIGEAPDKPARNRLIALKRELYNLRPVPEPRLGETLALLQDPSAREATARFAADVAERVRAEQALRDAYGSETPALRDRFRELVKDPDFRAGLMISSRSLFGSLPRYAAAGGELSGKDQKTERGLLRYYTRMAMKATPFSTFCAIVSGTFAEAADGGAVVRFEGDPREKTSYVRIMNPDLQHYHVPVNADVHAIETMFVEEDDRIVNPLGVKGMGELGMVGIPAAIANAVFHATGRRIRNLPITPDKLL